MDILNNGQRGLLPLREVVASRPASGGAPSRLSRERPRVAQRPATGWLVVFRQVDDTSEPILS